MKDSALPYAWIRKIPESIAKADTIPLLGAPPPFPWKDLAQNLKNIFELQSLEIATSEYNWMEEGTAATGMGSPLAITKFSVPSLEGYFFIAIPKDDIHKFMDLLLLQGKELAPLDDQFQSAFFDFLVLETIHAVQQTGYTSHLTAKIETEGELPESPLLAINLSVTVNGFHSTPRLLISPELNQSLATHFSQDKTSQITSHPLAEQCDVTLHMEAGKTTLSQTEWQSVKPGDFILLDRCSLQPGKNSGTITLTLQGHPLLRANIQDDNIKILENPLFREDNQP